MTPPNVIELTILYTHGLRGDLALLPRLYTQLKRLRHEPNGHLLLLDSGDSCSPDAWHCAVTGGRSMIIALDGMGYDLARADLPPDARAKLGDAVRIAVVDSAHSWERDGIRATAAPGSPADARLEIDLSAASVTALRQHTLTLAAVKAGQVGRVRLRLADMVSFTASDKGKPGVELPMETLPKLLAAEVIDLPDGTPPDPTIAGVVDFIVAEARYADQRRTRKRDG